MLESLVEWMGYPLYYAFDGASPPPTGADHAAIYPYGSFMTGDGDTVILRCRAIGNGGSFAPKSWVSRRCQRPICHQYGTISRVRCCIPSSWKLCSALDEAWFRVGRGRIAAADQRYGSGWNHPQLVRVDGGLRLRRPRAGCGDASARRERCGRGLHGCRAGFGQHNASRPGEFGFDPQEIVDLGRPVYCDGNLDV